MCGQTRANAPRRVSAADRDAAGTLGAAEYRHRTHTLTHTHTHFFFSQASAYNYRRVRLDLSEWLRKNAVRGQQTLCAL